MSGIVTMDFETRSRVELGKHGLSVYAHDDSTSVLCMAWASGDGPVNLWRPGEPLPDELFKANIVYAHNAGFEITILKHVLDVECDRFRCSATHAAAVGLPRSLERACGALELGASGKDVGGHNVMRTTCRPDKHGDWVEDAETLERLFEYCRRDVQAERNLEAELPNVHPNVWQNWSTLQVINERGIPIDRELCEGAVAILDAAMSRSQTIADALSGGAIKTGGQVKKIQNFVNERGVNIDNLRAESVDWALSQDVDKDSRAMLELRQSVASAAAKKYSAFSDRVDDDNRLRCAYTAFGAHTGRASSSGGQMQNLKLPPKGFITDSLIDSIKTGNISILESLYDLPPITLLGNAVRAAVRASEGLNFVFADLSQIEVRIAHWLAGNQRMLEVFEKGVDPYIDFARHFFHTETVTPEQRQHSKVLVLGENYGMGMARLAEYAKQYGITLSQQEAKKSIDFYRTLNRPIVRFWKNIEAAAVTCVATGRACKIGKLLFEMERQWCTMQLPSGRKMFYFKPTLTNGKYGPVFSYQNTRGMHEALWGGTFTENACQAITADLINEAMFHCEQEGIGACLNQHDELGIETDDPEAVTRKLREIMRDRPVWAKDLPIDTEVRIRKRFLK